MNLISTFQAISRSVVFSLTVVMDMIMSSVCDDDEKHLECRSSLMDFTLKILVHLIVHIEMQFLAFHHFLWSCFHVSYRNLYTHNHNPVTSMISCVQSNVLLTLKTGFLPGGMKLGSVVNNICDLLSL